MAVKSEDLQKYLSANLSVNELYEVLKTEEKDTADRAEQEKKAEIAAFDPFIGKYVLLVHNFTSRGLFHITGNIRLNSNASNTISVIRDQGITTYKGHCNHLWFPPEKEGKSWWFITKEQYEEVLNQYNNLNKIVFNYETTRNSD